MYQVAFERGGVGAVDPVVGRAMDVDPQQLLLLLPADDLLELGELEFVPLEVARQRPIGLFDCEIVGRESGLQRLGRDNPGWRLLGPEDWHDGLLSG